jgi:hypothetical protein
MPVLHLIGYNKHTQGVGRNPNRPVHAPSRITKWPPLYRGRKLKLLRFYLKAYQIVRLITRIKIKYHLPYIRCFVSELWAKRKKVDDTSRGKNIFFLRGGSFRNFSKKKALVKSFRGATLSSRRAPLKCHNFHPFTITNRQRVFG